MGCRVGRAKASEIDTPSKRAKLAPRKNPYWQGVSGGRGGTSLGYRKGASGRGSWIAKIVVDGQRYEERLGAADDDGAPNEVALSYRTAVAAALDWATRQYAAIQAQSEEKAGSAAPTIRSAIEAYVRARKRKSLATGKNAEGRLVRYALSDAAFAELKLAKLRAGAIEAWRDRLPIRSGNVDDEEIGEEESATRFISPSTVNRLMNDLRAGLNAAAEKHRRELPAGVMAEIKIGTRAMSIEVSTARKQLLTSAEIQKLIAAAFEVDDTGDFGRLVLLAAVTGARYSQLTAISVQDIRTRPARILVPGSRKGRSPKTKPPAAVPVAPDILDRLAPALDGRSGTETLLLRWGYRSVGPFEWERDKRRPWGPAYETYKPWKAAVASAQLPPDTVMYALRHSSIVRTLTAGVPIRVVAALHDTSVEMIEAHYSAYITEATDEIVRRAVLEV